MKKSVLNDLKTRRKATTLPFSKMQEYEATAIILNFSSRFFSS